MTSIGRKISAKEERLWCAFSKVDLNHDGKLSAMEIQKVIGGDEKEVQQMIQEVDADGDGEVDFDEVSKQHRTGGFRSSLRRAVSFGFVGS